MGYKKPIPVEINKIVIGKKYYTCSYRKIIYVFLTIFLYFLKCPQSLIL